MSQWLTLQCCCNRRRAFCSCRSTSDTCAKHKCSFESAFTNVTITLKYLNVPSTIVSTGDLCQAPTRVWCPSSLSKGSQYVSLASVHPLSPLDYIDYRMRSNAPQTTATFSVCRIARKHTDLFSMDCFPLDISM